MADEGTRSLSDEEIMTRRAHGETAPIPDTDEGDADADDADAGDAQDDADTSDPDTGPLDSGT